jgi:hypothetical protein
MNSSMRVLAVALGLGLAMSAGAAEEATPPAPADAAKAAAPSKADPKPAAPSAPAETGPAPADAKPAAPAEAKPEAAKPEAKPEAAAPVVESEAPAKPARAPHVVTLGPVGHDAQGRAGRIHTVAGGDTLWDISDAYLGTPWVWPSVWAENDNVANPHLIRPGDKLWVSPTEIRRVTDAEAGALINGRPAGGAASLDEGTDGMAEPGAGRPHMYRVSHRDGVGLVSEEELAGSSSLVHRPGDDRIWFGSMDRLNVSTKEHAVEKGDQLAIFRARERVYDPTTGRALGWRVQVLGWAEVVEPAAETALVEVRMAYAEMRVGDRLLPRERLPIEIELRPTQPGVDGQIVTLSDERTEDGTLDTVFLNRGAADGLEVGSTLQIYSPEDPVRDPISGGFVDVPPTVVGSLVVVNALPNSATAVVAEATREIEPGDRFRSSE